jgi:hypothetical protein
MKQVYFAPPFVVEISQQTHLRIVNFLKRICPIPQSDAFAYSRIAIVRKRNNNRESTYHLVAGEMKSAEKKSHELKHSRVDSNTK